MEMSNIVVLNAGNKLVTSSRNVADIFGKRHAHIIRDIERIIAEMPKEFTEPNFGLSEYTDSTGRKLPQYILTKDGFTFLAMGFTGQKAGLFKIAYINRFNEMEAALYGKVVTVQDMINDHLQRERESKRLASDGSGKMHKRKKEIPIFNEERVMLDGMAQPKLFFGDNHG
jgi:Rha family phage regulatory protein